MSSSQQTPIFDFRLFCLVKQTLIQSNIDNANQLNVNEQRATEELEKLKQVIFSRQENLSLTGFCHLGSHAKVIRL